MMSEDKSGLGDPDAMVIGRSWDSRWKIFPTVTRFLTATMSSEAFCDEGEVAKKRPSH